MLNLLHFYISTFRSMCAALSWFRAFLACCSGILWIILKHYYYYYYVATTTTNNNNNRSGDSIASIAIRLWAGRSWFRISVQARYWSHLQNVHPASCSMGPRHVADCSRPSSAEIQHTWSCTFTPRVCLNVVYMALLTFIFRVITAVGCAVVDHTIVFVSQLISDYF